jgi:hypothetical protein
MTDPRIAALAEALQAAGCVPSCAGCGAEITYHADCPEADGTLVWETDAAAILAALPPDWWVEQDAEIANLRKIEEAARALVSTYGPYYEGDAAEALRAALGSER